MLISAKEMWLRKGNLKIQQCGLTLMGKNTNTAVRNWWSFLCIISGGGKKSPRKRCHLFLNTCRDCAGRALKFKNIIAYPEQCSCAMAVEERGETIGVIPLICQGRYFLKKYGEGAKTTRTNLALPQQDQGTVTRAWTLSPGALWSLHWQHPLQNPG